MGIRQDQVESPGAGRLIDRIAQGDLRLDIMQIKIYGGHAAGAVDQVLAEVDGGADALGHVAVEGTSLGLGLEPFISGDQETAGADSRVGDGEVAVDAAVGLDAAS